MTYIQGVLYTSQRSWLNTVCFKYYSQSVTCIIMHISTCKIGIHSKNKCVLLFYTLLLKLKLFLSNRRENSTLAPLLILLLKRHSIFGYHLQMLNCVEVNLSVFIKADNPRILSPQSSTSEVDIQRWKPLFFIKRIKVTLVKNFMPIGHKMTDQF